MRRWAFIAALAFAGLLALVSPAAADDNQAEAKPFHIIFFGYQTLNGQVFIQVHISDLPPADQPGLVKIGDPLDLGALGIYTFGAFHENANVIEPLTGKPAPATVELIDAAGHKTILKFRRAIEVKAFPGRMT